MKPYHRNWAMALTILGLLWAGPALAQMAGHGMKEKEKKDSGMSMEMGGKSGHGMDGGQSMGHLFGPAWMKTLTDDQKTKADVMHLQLKKGLSTLEAEKDLREAELDLLVVQDRPDRKAVEKKIGELVELKQQILLKKTLHRMDMRAMLTPEQRVSFDMMMLGKSGHGR